MVEAIWPLRVSTGRALPVKRVDLLGHSDLLSPDQIQVELRISQQEAEDDVVYRDLHPSVWLAGDGTASQFGVEVRTYRMPVDLPVSIPENFASLFIIGPAVENVRDGRKLWAEFGLEIGDPDDKAITPLVGGLIVGGYPYMPSYLSSQGEPAANHGYPREVRVTWNSGNDNAGFIDDETSQTQQLPAWQSSHHVLAISPVRTRYVRLRISDLGRRIKTLRSWNSQTEQYQEYWAMALPFVYAFEYEESAVREVNLSPGMICVTQSNRKRGSGFFTPALDASAGGQWDGAESAWIARHDQRAYPFTPQSALIHSKSRREYPILTDNKSVREFFISNELEKDDRLFWLLAQRDEHGRCLAGLRLQMAAQSLREELKIAVQATVRLQVYEVDPLPGTPVARILPDLVHDRFSRLLADEVIGKDVEEVLVRFSRVTASRHLYLVFTALDRTQIAIDSLFLVRSAAASVAMRPSRSRQIRAIHFRVIGENLGEDYARIGQSGFSIAVDRIVAGETRERLFYAHSLEQLVRDGAVRMLVNSRVRAVEVQKTVVMPGSYSETTNVQKSVGWQRSETGRDVSAPQPWQNSPRMRPDGQHQFTVMGNEENRTFVSHIAKVPDFYRDKIGSLFPTLRARTAPNDDRLWRGVDNNTAWTPWRTNTTTFRLGTLRNAVSVSGLFNVSIPPYWNSLMDEVTDKKDMGQIESALQTFTDSLFIINGAGIGTGRGAGFLIPNFSWSNNIAASGVATALEAHSIGTTGSITLSARQSGYSYSQNLTAQATDTDGKTEYVSSEHTQTFTRSVAEEPLARDERMKGAEVVWNHRVVDILVGIIPLRMDLPAYQDSGYRTTDESIRVSFTGHSDEVMADAWFEATEELVRDDD